MLNTVQLKKTQANEENIFTALTTHMLHLEEMHIQQLKRKQIKKHIHQHDNTYKA